MAITDQTVAPPKGPSMVVQIAVLLAMTGAAVGGGWFAGIYLNKETKAAMAGSAAPAAASGHEAPSKPGDHGKAEKEGGHDAPKEGEHGEAGPLSPLIVTLAPITTNLAAPSQIWIRLEASIVYDVPQPPELADIVHQDMLAYLRTLKLHQIEGPSGFQHLKADLEERAKIRSDNHVTQVLIRTLLLE